MTDFRANKENCWYEIILKNGVPFLRNHRFWSYKNEWEVTDMKIYKAKSDSPYCKFASRFIGLLYLEDDMKEALKAVLVA